MYSFKHGVGILLLGATIACHIATGESNRLIRTGYAAPKYSYSSYHRPKSYGAPGPKGPQGPRGYRGFTGKNGMMGKTGRGGRKGATGKAGSPGYSGPRGSKVGCQALKHIPCLIS